MLIVIKHRRAVRDHDLLDKTFRVDYDSNIRVLKGLPPKEFPMTKKQIRDLQEFAVVLAKEGRHDAAKEVLALLARA